MEGMTDAPSVRHIRGVGRIIPRAPAPVHRGSGSTCRASSSRCTTRLRRGTAGVASTGRRTVAVACGRRVTGGRSPEHGRVVLLLAHLVFADRAGNTAESLNTVSGQSVGKGW